MSLRLIERVEDWVEDGRVGDWLHPNYGPFPHFAAFYADDDWEYLSAVWRIGPKNHPHGWIALVEGPDEISCVLRSYYWRIEQRSPLLVSATMGKTRVVDMRVPKSGRPMRMIAKMSVLMLKQELFIE